MRVKDLYKILENIRPTVPGLTEEGFLNMEVGIVLKNPDGTGIIGSELTTICPAKRADDLNAPDSLIIFTNEDTSDLIGASEVPTYAHGVTPMGEA